MRTLEGRDLYIMSDDTSSTDKGKCMSAVAVGSLDLDHIHHTISLTTFGKTPNAEQIAQEIEEGLLKFFPNGFDPARVKLFVSDSASTMKKVGKLLAKKFPNMRAVTCCTHALHLTCEQVRKEFPLTDECFSLLNRVMCNSYARKVDFREASNIPPSDSSKDPIKLDPRILQLIASEHDYCSTLAEGFAQDPLNPTFGELLESNDTCLQFALKTTILSDSSVLDSATPTSTITNIRSVLKGADFKMLADVSLMAYFGPQEESNHTTYMDVSTEYFEIPFGIVSDKVTAEVLLIEGVILFRKSGGGRAVLQGDFTADELRNFIASNRLLYSQEREGILPCHPVKTRFGTWVKAVCFYRFYWQRTVNFISTLKPKTGQDKSAVSRLQKLIEESGDTIRSQIEYIYNNYSLLPVYIAMLERDNLELDKSVEIMNKVQLMLKFTSDLEEKDDGAAHKVLNKFEFVLKKNNGLAQLVTSASRTLSGNSRPSPPCAWSASSVSTVT